MLLRGEKRLACALGSALILSLPFYWILFIWFQPSNHLSEIGEGVDDQNAESVKKANFRFRWKSCRPCQNRSPHPILTGRQLNRRSHMNTARM